MFKQMKSFLVIAGLGLALAPAAQAAVVIWESAVLIKDVGATNSVNGSDAVISTEGSLVTAIDFQYRYDIFGDQTVNGVTFAVNPGQSSSHGPVDAGFTDFYQNSRATSHTDDNNNIGADFGLLLQGHAYSQNADTSTDIELQGLTDGESYLVQFLVGVNAAATSGNQVFTGGGGVSGSISTTEYFSLVGRFQADGLTQAINIAGSSTGDRNPYISAVQWRQVAAPGGGVSVPEPATATLALLGLGGLMMRRRRQA
jgi:hypothetical protein